MVPYKRSAQFADYRLQTADQTDDQLQTPDQGANDRINKQ